MVSQPMTDIAIVSYLAFVSFLIFCCVFTDCSAGDLMDLKARERTWLLQLDSVFREDSTLGDLTARGKVSEIQNSIKLLMHKRIKIWWNKAFLEKYLQKNLIPRGLRIQVFPSFPIEDETFTSRWEEICNNGSNKFMELLIGHNKKSLDQLDIEIDVLQKQLNETWNDNEKEKFNLSMDKTFLMWEKEIQEGKTKKFSRDLNDLQQKKVYKWRQRRTPYRIPNRSYRSSSVSSASSQGESNPPHPMATRYNSKGKGKNDNQKSVNTKRKQDQPGTSDINLKVINLSDHILTDVDVSLLQKGLTFSPSDHFNTFSAVKDLHIFARSLIFKKWHHKKDSDEYDTIFETESERNAVRILEELAAENEPETQAIGMIPECIRVKSKKFPPLSVCPAVDLFVKMVTKDFEALPTSICNDNLTSEQRSSLKKLRELKDILFKPADKGGNLVVWPKKQYETEAYRQLRDRTCYQKLSFNPLISFRQKLDEILNRY